MHRQAVNVLVDEVLEGVNHMGGILYTHWPFPIVDNHITLLLPCGGDLTVGVMPIIF